MRLRLFCVPALLLAAAPAAAQTGTFTFNAATGTAVWNDANSWTPNTAFPNAIDAVANFPAATGARTVQINANVTVGQLIMNAPTADVATNFIGVGTNRTITFNSSSGPAMFTLNGPTTLGSGSFNGTAGTRVALGLGSDLIVTQNQNVDAIAGYTLSNSLAGGNFVLTKEGTGNLTLGTSGGGHTGTIVVNAGGSTSLATG